MEKYELGSDKLPRKLVRMFNKKRFRRYHSYNTQIDARLSAEQLRGQGWLVRITKGKPSGVGRGVWTVYHTYTIWRRKKG